MQTRKKKRYTLVYSKKTDHGIYNIVVYRQHPFDILAARCTGEIEQAKQRVEVTAEGRYKYEPSREYKKLYKKYYKQKKRAQEKNKLLYDQDNQQPTL